ncbi:hypothetical protein SIPHO054v2_p0042 [Vibrio phage 103E44.1]|nr:hypothetical protein SIPHO054v2_p0042 [Vibrio phage 103E44.1]QZI87896.1 hypothetical protein SIPHO055v2_p0041 [Vibrio phage 104E43.1]
MSPEINDMSDEEIRVEIKHLVKAVESNSETTNAIASNVTKLTEFMIRNEESKSRQNEINHDLVRENESRKSEIKDLNKAVNEINLSRAKEEQSRNFIMKYWPWLLVAVVLGTGFVTFLLRTAIPTG